RADRGATCLPQLECRVRIARHEDALDAALDRLMRGDDVTEFVKDAFQAQREARLASHHQGTVKYVGKPSRIVHVDDADAGTPAARIDGDDRRGAGSGRLSLPRPIPLAR